MTEQNTAPLASHGDAAGPITLSPSVVGPTPSPHNICLDCGATIPLHDRHLYRYQCRACVRPLGNGGA